MFKKPISTLFPLLRLFRAKDHFSNIGKLLLHGSEYLNSEAVTRYDIAYPLLLILSGYPIHHSLIGIALLNTIMAILMPILIYFALRPTFPRGAYYVALATIFSLSPFYYIKFARPDHAYMFFTMLSICYLIFFINTKRSYFFYAMVAAVIITSLLRTAGNILLPFFLLLAFLFDRGSFKKYLICFCLGLVIFFSYSHFTQQFFAKFGDRKSFNGGQTFQNLYVNSKTFKIHLSPDLGPAMQTITNNLYLAILPRPSQSSFIRAEGSPVESLSTYVTSEDFLKEHVYPYSADEMIKQIYNSPCWDYSYMLYIATPNDPLFLKASWEIVRRYPWYPFAYTSKNMWHLLYDPGFEHDRYTLDALRRSSIRDAFPYDATTNDISNLSDRATRELRFDTMANKADSMKKTIYLIKKYFCRAYLPFTKILFYFMTIARGAVIIDFISRFTSFKKIQALAALLPKKITPIVIVLSLYLFLSMLIISVFVDPILRLHNHLIPFKIMLAGLGASILWHIANQLKLLPASWQSTDLIVDESTAAPSKNNKLLIIASLMMVIALLISWSVYILIHTQ